jgi:hypothetical protein
MKLEVRPYEGDSIIRHGPTTSPEPVTGQGQAHSTLGLPQRNTTPAIISAREIAEIEARARALRAAAVADLLGRAWRWLGASFERARRRREEKYLAHSQNLAELEHRLRKLERQGHVLHI